MLRGPFPQNVPLRFCSRVVRHMLGSSLHVSIGIRRASRGKSQLAERLRQAEGLVELQIGEGFWHTWPITAATRPFPEGTAALEHISAFVRLQCEKSHV